MFFLPQKYIWNINIPSSAIVNEAQRLTTMRISDHSFHVCACPLWFILGRETRGICENRNLTLSLPFLKPWASFLLLWNIQNLYETTDTVVLTASILSHGTLSLIFMLFIFWLSFRFQGLFTEFIGSVSSLPQGGIFV